MSRRARIVSHASSSLVALLVAAGCQDSTSTPDSGPLPVDQCTNAADIALVTALAATTDGGLPDGGVPDGGPYPSILLVAMGDAVDMCTTGPCLSSVLNDDALKECIDTCLATTPAAGLSIGCRDCNIEVIHCTTAHCVTECLGTDRSMCEACATVNCVPRLAECTGLTPPSIP